MQRRHGIGAARHVQTHYGHAKHFVVVERIDSAKFHHSSRWQAQTLSKRTQMLFNQVAIESVVTGRHRGMRCKHHSSGNASDRLVERYPFILHPHAYRFKHREHTVTFVEVQNRWLQAHGAKCLETANAEKQFLSDPHSAIATIKA